MISPLSVVGVFDCTDLARSVSSRRALCLSVVDYNKPGMDDPFTKEKVGSSNLLFRSIRELRGDRPIGRSLSFWCLFAGLVEFDISWLFLFGSGAVKHLIGNSCRIR